MSMCSCGDVLAELLDLLDLAGELLGKGLLQGLRIVSGCQVLSGDGRLTLAFVEE